MWAKLQSFFDLVKTTFANDQAMIHSLLQNAVLCYEILLFHDNKSFIVSILVILYNKVFEKGVRFPKDILNYLVS